MGNTDRETDSKQIRLVVDEELVAQWDEFWQADPEYASRADLIRTAVAHEMADATASSDGAGSDDLTVQMAKLTDRIDDLLERTETIESDIRSLKTDVRTDSGTEELATRLYNHLPTDKPGSDEWLTELAAREQTVEAASDETPTKPDPAASKQRLREWQASVQDLAVALEEPEHRVREAIGKLLTDTHAVRDVEYDGKTRYWKEV